MHSGDSSCTIPPYTLSEAQLDRIREQTIALARELKVVGLMNVQFAVKGTQVYVLEVNPRASRTVPFLSKATSVPLAKVAAKVMLGKSLRECGVSEGILPLLAEEANQQWTARFNPRPVTEADILRIYQAAW